MTTITIRKDDASPSPTRRTPPSPTHSSSRRVSPLFQCAIVALGLLLIPILDDLVQAITLMVDCNQVAVASRRRSNTSSYSTMAQSNETLQHQVRLQAEFQDLIYRNQHPTTESCNVRRILFTRKEPILYDGFTLEIQSYGRHLQSAMAQDRTFVMRNNVPSAYAPRSCTYGAESNHVRNNQFECLFQPLSSCSEDSVKEEEETHNDRSSSSNNANNMAGFGVVRDQSEFFQTLRYGPQRVVDNEFGNLTTHGDHIEHWERSMGRFWLRAQFAHYIWNYPFVDFRKEMETKLPKKLFAVGTPYIAMHVRFTDNIGSLYRDFGRDARKTRSVDHFMGIAGKIRQKTGISTIYIATDSNSFLSTLFANNSTHAKDGWTFHLQDGVARADTESWMWFAGDRHKSGAGIAADVEVLRRADYLIGSFQSNVYRLATELNTAYHIGNYSLHMHRHYPVDIEWYEDP